jgi:type I restriction enzyme M protein
VEDKNKKMVWAEQHDVEIGSRRFKSDLLPRNILIDQYFTAEQKNIETLEANADAIAAQIEELVEEYSGEGDKAYFAELDKVNKAEAGKELKKVLAELKTDKDNEELQEKKTVFEKYLKLLEEQTEANKKLKEAKAALEKLLFEKYATLTEIEIKTLVVENKWMATLEHSVNNEMQRISQRLTQRIKELAERYETPMPTLLNEVSQWEGKINAHLAKMGFAWS